MYRLPMPRPVPADSSFAARVALAAEALAIDAADLVPHLTDVTDGPLLTPMVWTDADAQLLGIAASLPADALLPRRMTVLAAGISGSTALARTTMARAGEVWIERWSDRRAVVALMGTATLDDDVAALAAIGTSEANAAAAGERLRLLTDAGAHLRLLRTTIRPGDVETCELGVQATPDVLARIAASADALGIGGPQQRMLAGVHAILARGRPVLLRVGVRGADLVPGLSLTYGPQSVEDALRVVTGLATRADAAARFGTLTGSLGCERVAAVELAARPDRSGPGSDRDRAVTQQRQCAASASGSGGQSAASSMVGVSQRRRP